jgi:hypothetical protein
VQRAENQTPVARPFQIGLDHSVDVCCLPHHNAGSFKLELLQVSRPGSVPTSPGNKKAALSGAQFPWEKLKVVLIALVELI